MKSLVIYEMVPEETRLYLLDGDYSRFSGHFVNTTNEIPEDIAEQLSNGFDEKFRVESPVKLDSETIVVLCGFIL